MAFSEAILTELRKARGLSRKNAIVAEMSSFPYFDSRDLSNNIRNKWRIPLNITANLKRVQLYKTRPKTCSRKGFRVEWKFKFLRTQRSPNRRDFHALNNRGDRIVNQIFSAK